jgi:hypothetical protein
MEEQPSLAKRPRCAAATSGDSISGAIDDAGTMAISQEVPARLCLVSYSLALGITTEADTASEKLHTPQKPTTSTTTRGDRGDVNDSRTVRGTTAGEGSVLTSCSDGSASHGGGDVLDMRMLQRLNAAAQQLAAASAAGTASAGSSGSMSNSNSTSNAIAAISAVIGSNASGAREERSGGTGDGGCEWLRGYCTFIATRHRLPGWAF